MSSERYRKMKIAPFVAAVSAQLPDLGNFDLSNFDLSQFGLGPAIQVPVPDAVVSLIPRYFYEN